MSQLGSGPDGVRYEGVDSFEDTPVTVDRLFLAKQNAPRWLHLCHRITLLQKTPIVGALPVRMWVDSGSEPYLVTPRPPKTLADVLRAGTPGPDAVVRWGQQLAATLAGAHHIGIPHGSLMPATVALGGSDVALDLYGAVTFQPWLLSDLDRSCLPPEGEEWTLEGDVYALGALLVALRTGKPVTSDVDDHGTPTQQFSTQRIEVLIGEMLDPVPEQRPTMGDVVERLARTADAGAPASGSTPNASGSQDGAVSSDANTAVFLILFMPICSSWF